MAEAADEGGEVGGGYAAGVFLVEDGEYFLVVDEFLLGETLECEGFHLISKITKNNYNHLNNFDCYQEPNERPEMQIGNRMTDCE